MASLPLPPTFKHTAAVYFAAVVAVALAYLVRLVMAPVLHDRAPLLLFVLPVVAAVLYGGRGAGLLAGFLSLLASFSLVPASARGSAPMLIEGLFFIVVCSGIGLLGGRLAAERQLARRASEQLRLLLEGASQYAIFMLDPLGTISTWNSGAERIYGWTADEVLGRHFAMLSTETNAPEIAADELERARTEGRFTCEAWQVRRDGSEFLANVTITPIVGEGRLHGYAKVIHDVTDRRASELALEKREQHLQSILDTVPDAMIVIDDKGVVISFSPAAERLFGYSPPEVIGNNVSMLMPSPDRERHDSYLERYIATGVPHIIGIGRIVTGLRADGSTFPMKLSVGEAVTPDQRLFTGFVQDLTERKDFEARLEQLKSELIHVSRVSAMGTMASTLAHELNQPLTAIASYGQAAEALLESDTDIDKALLTEIVSEISGQSLRAGGIVRRLREFVSRGEVSKTVEDLPKLIGEASALALVGTREKGVTAHFNYGPEATPVLVDRVQIQQVLINLMRNAIEAMQDSPVRRLTVTTGLVDDTTVQVSVHDTGPGISADAAEHLFEAFNSTKQTGMGLGLSICRTIVEAHGGRIHAVPHEGGGAEFRFTLVRPPPGTTET